MKSPALFACLLAAVPAQANHRAALVPGARVMPGPAILAATPALSPVPTLPAALIPPAVISPPAPQPAASAVSAKLAALSAKTTEVIAGLEKSGGISGADAHAAGRRIETLLTGEEPSLTAPEESVGAPPTPDEPRPEDPHGYASVSVPGSVFGWRPIEDSPGHGFAPIDWIVRRVFAESQGSYAEGFELRGSPRREGARVHFYGERHTDGDLIAANMARLAADLRPGGKAIVLVEGFLGWPLRGYTAAKYLIDRGLAPETLSAKGMTSGDLEVRGWDAPLHYDEAKRLSLQSHMDLLELNRLAHGSRRGWNYYRRLASAIRQILRSRRELWQAAIVVRNDDLDAAVAKAVQDAETTRATVHVIAGTDHLMQRPLLARVPLLGRPSLRLGLREALGGRAYWASKPPSNLER